ncbi:flagellar brake protein [Gracilibacillus kekensis]|uniref:C-di-GMP-binding flagellar brake protein YcgR, contains PilZNR and PilZ domains n=1 Tax=Gracilibacillus kekensis TaxID=1027249 RepID=A0A1M7PRC0_9BACI|nr:flagellar brake domain-containing protein [Gracilibacillus kekensis]SHN19869.1 c-di-GMP-binding flagellar brake protein YcgR, contains PilZNR and PilZ domains [Gracilibacillus kekensis]
MIKIGTFLQIEENKIFYKCRVVHTKSNKLYIDYPINENTNRTELFSVGTLFRISFIEKSSVYSFRSEIIGKGKMKNIPTLILSFEPENLKKIQRREFVRIEALLDLSVKTKISSQSFTTVTHDISGGGLSFIADSDSSIMENEEVDLMLILPLDNKIEYLHIIGKTVRIHERKEENNLVSIKFEEINPHDQQLIVRFGFLKQLQARQKGLS